MATMYIRMEASTLSLAPPVLGVDIVSFSPETHHHLIPQIYAEAFCEAPWPETWSQIEEFDPNGVFLAVAEDADAPVGFVVSFPRADIGYISVAAVIPQFQGMGVGSALIVHAGKYLQSLGLNALRIDVLSSNQPAIRVYQSLGFREVLRFSD